MGIQQLDTVDDNPSDHVYYRDNRGHRLAARHHRHHGDARVEATAPAVTPAREQSLGASAGSR
jgi:hypothetical protein